MMKIKESILGFAIIILGGCVSDSDLMVIQSQMTVLNSKVDTIQKKFDSLQNELNFVKKQRVIRLPTGAPTKNQARNTTKPTYIITVEESHFNAAKSAYQSGDAQSAIRAFEQFNTTYPNSKYHSDVLYNLGEANYTVRDYQRAQEVLEELIYQTPSSKSNPKALGLLRKVYQAQGENAKIAKLQDFINNMNTPTL
ncbi:MAG: outer membrane protein assembly factor BamD [Ostreibacterium sp.]